MKIEKEPTAQKFYEFLALKKTFGFLNSEIFDFTCHKHLCLRAFKKAGPKLYFTGNMKNTTFINLLEL